MANQTKINQEKFIKRMDELLGDQPEWDVVRITDSLISQRDETMGHIDIIYAHLYAAWFFARELDHADIEEFSADVFTMDIKAV